MLNVILRLNLIKQQANCYFENKYLVMQLIKKKSKLTNNFWDYLIKIYIENIGNL
jgi:hypothetical protein